MATAHAPAAKRSPADTAYRRAWWSVGLFPVSFVLAFVIGEGLYAAMVGEGGHAAWWQMVLAAGPAMVVFVVPGFLAVHEGRRAIALGRPDGKVPAIVGAIIAGGFVVQNLASYLLGLIFG